MSYAGLNRKEVKKPVAFHLVSRPKLEGLKCFKHSGFSLRFEYLSEKTNGIGKKA